ncbi:MAG: PorP/SprF family type IX secretion system membrane protein [Bacteroidota bacterium]
MKRIVLVVMLLVSAGFVNAQQMSVSNLHSINPYLINPAFTGYLTDISGYATIGMPLSFKGGEIRNYQAGFNKAIESKSIGVGGKLVFDQRDFFESISFSGSFAYRMAINKNHVLSFGTDVGFVNRSYDVDGLNAFVDLDDPTLSSDYYFQSNLLLGFGLGYYSSKIEAGLSMPLVVEGGESLNTTTHAYFGYRHFFNNNFWFVKPTVLFTYLPDQPDELMLNVMVQKNGAFFGQLGASNNQDVMVSFGIYFNEFLVSYVYRENLGNENLPFNAMNEIGIQFQVGRSRMRFSNIGNQLNLKQ